MFECRLGSDADLGWALERVGEGQSVRVTVPEPVGTAAYRRRQVGLANRRLIAAYAQAEVSNVAYRIHGRRRRREYCVAQFVVSPKSPGDPSGVREPRRPLEPSPALSAQLDFPGGFATS